MHTNKNTHNVSTGLLRRCACMCVRKKASSWKNGMRTKRAKSKTKRAREKIVKSAKEHIFVQSLTVPHIRCSCNFIEVPFWLYSRSMTLIVCRLIWWCIVFYIVCLFFSECVRVYFFYLFFLFLDLFVRSLFYWMLFRLSQFYDFKWTLILDRYVRLVSSVEFIIKRFKRK